MKNLFTTEDAAMLLIDHQVGTIKLAISTPHDDSCATRARSPARRSRRACRWCSPPARRTTFQGLLLDDLQQLAPDAYAKRVKRPGTVDCWLFEPFRQAVLATGRRKLIMAGLTNDVCIVFPAISAVEEGFSVQVVADAGGSPTKAADNAAIERMRAHGVVITSTNQVLAELATDWASAGGSAIQRVLYEENLRHLVEA
jgi:nicotinamidase-related amidase